MDKTEKQEEWREDIVALIYGIDKSQSILKTKENSTLLFDYISQLLSERTFTKEEWAFIRRGLSYTVGCLEEKKMWEKVTSKIAKLKEQE